MVGRSLRPQCLTHVERVTGQVTGRVTVRPENYLRAAARPGFDTGEPVGGDGGTAAWDAVA
ncbi:hypothetical protein GCM10010341_87380 [Streptomyces noursei]|nr:hypothetical protein GCM10010341_87380 [Streptomyces noursei]